MKTSLKKDPSCAQLHPRSTPSHAARAAPTPTQREELAQILGPRVVDETGFVMSVDLPPTSLKIIKCGSRVSRLQNHTPEK